MQGRLLFVVGFFLLFLSVCSTGQGQLSEVVPDQLLTGQFDAQQMGEAAGLVELRNNRGRMFAQDPQSERSSPTYRMALDDAVPALRVLSDRQYDFSPDGTEIVYQASDGLYVSDATGTVRRPLVKQSEDRKDWFVIFFRVGQPRWSPDGKHIAYFAGRIRPPGNDPEDLIWTIFLVDAEGGTPRQLVESLVHEPYGGLCWTPDGAGLTYLSREGVQTLDLEGKSAGHVALEMEARHQPRLTGYSPNGQWLTFQLKADVESANNWETDIYVVPSDGGSAVRLTSMQGFDGNPAWSRDNSAVYFASARGTYGESSNIWKVNVDPQTGQPIGDPEQVTFFSDARTAHLQVVGDGSRIAFFLQKKRHSIHVAPDVEPEQARTLARGQYPLLSPDGKTVYYVGEGPENQGIFSVATSGGTPQRVAAIAPVVDRVDLSPDGKSLTFFATLDAERGLYTQSLDGGQPILRARTGGDECCSSPRWSPDGQSIAYTYGDGLFSISMSGGAPQKLATLHGWEAWTLRWSPDGHYLAALGYLEGEENNAVYVIPAEGGEARRLSGFEHYKEGLEWHPDGQSLTYHLSKSKSQTNRTYLDGRPPELFLDKDDIWDYVGRWAPDGERYFLTGSLRAEGWRVYIYNTSSGEYTLFAEEAASLPSWSRDHKTMTWTVERASIQLWLMEDFE